MNALINGSLEMIKQLAIAEFKNKYGYCGMADMGDTVILNSGGDGETLKVTLKYQRDGETKTTKKGQN